MMNIPSHSHCNSPKNPHRPPRPRRPQSLLLHLISLFLLLPHAHAAQPAFRAFTRDAVTTITIPSPIPADALLFLERVNAPSTSSAPNAFMDKNGNILRGRLKGVAGGKAGFESNLLGLIERPLEDVHAIELTPGALARVTGPGPMVVLRNGDLLPGAIKSITEAGVEAESVFGAISFPWSDVAALVLTESQGVPPLNSDSLLFMTSGDELRAMSVSFGDGAKWDVEVRGLGRIAVDASGVAQLWYNGARIVSLTSLPSVQTPASEFMGHPRSIARNKALDGGHLRMGSRWYAEGFSGHAPCRITAPLPEGAAWIITDAGIGDETNGRGHVKFSLAVDARELAASELRGGEPPARLSAPVSGAASLVLSAEALADPPIGCHAVWGNPRLILSGGK